MPVLAAAGALVALIAVVAVVAGGSGGSGGSGGKKAATPGQASVEQTRPVTVTGTALADDTGDAPDPAVGKVIPEVKGAAFDGTPVTIANDGTPKLVMFVAHWCPHCRNEVPLLTKYLSANPLPTGIRLLAVSTGVNSASVNYPPSAWLQREHWPVTTMADDAKSSAATAFGLTGYPYFVAVDGAGKVVARASGELTTDEFAGLLQKATAAAS